MFGGEEDGDFRRGWAELALTSHAGTKIDSFTTIELLEFIEQVWKVEEGLGRERRNNEFARKRVVSGHSRVQSIIGLLFPTNITLTSWSILRTNCG